MSGKVIVIVALVVILVGLGIWAAIYYWGGNKGIKISDDGDKVGKADTSKIVSELKAKDKPLEKVESDTVKQIVIQLAALIRTDKDTLNLYSESLKPSFSKKDSSEKDKSDSSAKTSEGDKSNSGSSSKSSSTAKDGSSGSKTKEDSSKKSDENYNDKIKEFFESFKDNLFDSNDSVTKVMKDKKPENVYKVLSNIQELKYTKKNITKSSEIIDRCLKDVKAVKKDTEIELTTGEKVKVSRFVLGILVERIEVICKKETKETKESK